MTYDKKYEMTANTKIINGRKLFQIKAVVDFSNVKAGDLGGYIEKEENLSQYDNAWVYDNACVFGDARVFDNVCVYDNAWVYGYARVYDNACVYGYARVSGDARVFDNARVFDDACIYGNAWVYDNARVCRDAQIFSNADYIYFKGFGSENRYTSMFRTKNRDVYVRCGCFTGSLKAFTDKVKETHGSGKYAKEYLACAEVAKIHFEIGEEKE